MSERFQAPPVKEIVADIRWEPTNDEGVKVSSAVYKAHFERVLDQFIHLAEELGLTSSERIVPQNFPTYNHQAIMRAKSSKFSDSSGDNFSRVLYQIGHGVFTVNALPPYKSWEDFGPKVRSGLELLSKLDFDTYDKPREVNISLKYLNAFDDSFSQGRSIKDFMAQDLGVGLTLPDVVLEGAVDSYDIPLMDVVIPTQDTSLRLRFAEGKVSDEESYILDVTARHSDVLDFDIEAIMSAFAKSRADVHKVFFGLTEKLHSRMGLVSEE